MGGLAGHGIPAQESGLGPRVRVGKAEPERGPGWSRFAAAVQPTTRLNLNPRSPHHPPYQRVVLPASELMRPKVDGLYIVIPDRCTECWGIYISARCLDICPVEAVALDLDHPDDEASLARKFRLLHPGLEPRLIDMWRKPA